MKIHIKNMDLDNLSNNLFNLEKYLVKENEIIELSSDMGIFIIQNTHCFLLQNSEKEQQKNINHKYGKNEYELLLDFNDEITTKVQSQIPCQYILNKKTIMNYKLSKKSPFTLVIKGKYEKNTNTNTFLKKDKKFATQFGTTFVVTDFYFECSETDFQFENPFFVDEFNMFLSLLN